MSRSIDRYWHGPACWAECRWRLRIKRTAQDKFTEILIRGFTRFTFRVGLYSKDYSTLGCMLDGGPIEATIFINCKRTRLGLLGRRQRVAGTGPERPAELGHRGGGRRLWAGKSTKIRVSFPE